MAGPTAAICEVAPPDRSDIVGACQPLPCSLVRLRDSLNIEPHALRKWQLRPEIDRVRGSTHIRLPCIGAGFATASGLLLATKAPPISAPEGPTFTLAIAAVRARCRNKSLCLSNIEREDGRGEPCTNGVVHPNCFI